MPPAAGMPTPDGLLLVLAIMVPLIGMLATFGVGGRRGEWIALATMPIGLGVAIATASGVLRSGTSLQYVLGAWVPPLGIALRADGIAAAMLVATAVVVCAVAVFARADFCSDAAGEARAPFVFWTLLLSVWGALNAVFVAGDLFTLYVALELLTFAAVPLVCLDGRAEQFAAALRYLLFALVGSMFYLLGAVLLYGAYGVLDIALLAALVESEPATWTAAALMTTGLLAKTALFPLHLWLPPAHAGAPAAASAVLSALVVKGSYFLLVRVWLDVMPGVLAGTSAQLLAGLGATAIAFGSVVALRQARLKLLIAYSTVAQIGYLFLMFPLVLDGSAGPDVSQAALDGGILQAISHALAKAAMFMAAGLIYAGLGHDRIADLAGSARAMPLTVWTFALAGVSLIGLPPSGGFFAKWLLLRAAVATGHWVWVAVLLVGGLLTSAYVLLVLVRAFARPAAPLVLRSAIPRYREAAALTLAVFSVLLGLLAFSSIDLLSIGRAPLVRVQTP